MLERGDPDLELDDDEPRLGDCVSRGEVGAPEDGPRGFEPFTPIGRQSRSNPRELVVARVRHVAG